MYKPFVLIILLTAVFTAQAAAITVQVDNGEQRVLSRADLHTLHSEYLNLIAQQWQTAPSGKKEVSIYEEFPVSKITELPIRTLLPLELLLGASLSQVIYRDVLDAIELADYLVVSGDTMDRFMKRLAQENIKLICRLYQDPEIQGREELGRYILPLIPFDTRPAQRLGNVDNRIPAIGHTNSVTSVALSPDGNTIITGSNDHTAIVWHRGDDGQFRFNPEQDRLGMVNNREYGVGHTSSVVSVAQLDDRTIISGSWDNSIIVWHKKSVDEFCATQR